MFISVVYKIEIPCLGKCVWDKSNYPRKNTKTRSNEIKIIILPLKLNIVFKDAFIILSLYTLIWYAYYKK